MTDGLTAVALDVRVAEAAVGRLRVDEVRGLDAVAWAAGLERGDSLALATGLRGTGLPLDSDRDAPRRRLDVSAAFEVEAELVPETCSLVVLGEAPILFFARKLAVGELTLFFKLAEATAGRTSAVDSEAALRGKVAGATGFLAALTGVACFGAAFDSTGLFPSASDDGAPFALIAPSN